MSDVRKADPSRAIIAQIIATLSPLVFTLISAKSVDWASATFTGARHEFEFLFDGDDATEVAHSFAQNVNDIDFTIGGHIVADIVATFRERKYLFVEALSVEAV